MSSYQLNLIPQTETGRSRIQNWTGPGPQQILKSRAGLYQDQNTNLGSIQSDRSADTWTIESLQIADPIMRGGTVLAGLGQF